VQPVFIGPPHLRGTIRVRRVSFLRRVTNARGARLFPQSKSASQTK